MTKIIRVHYKYDTDRGEITDFISHHFEGDPPQGFIDSTKQSVSTSNDITLQDIEITAIEYRG